MNLFEPDELMVYQGEDFKINEHITVRQPTVGEVISMGESKYYSMIYSLTAYPSDMKAELDMIGIDYEQVSDFELFARLFLSTPDEDIQIILPGIRPSQFKYELVENQNRFILIWGEGKDATVIDEVIYKILTNYLCKAHGIEKKREQAMTAMTKKVLLELAYDDIEERKRAKHKSSLKPLISAAVNSAGFKYNLQQVREMKICQFMDSVARLQIISYSTALLQGCYTGNVDMKKLDKKELNFMREV